MFAVLLAQTEAGGSPPEIRERLERIVGALLPALRGAERSLPLWQRVERCWFRLAGPAVHGAEVDRLDARRFLDALATHDLPETLVGEALTELTDGLYSAGPGPTGAIQIMTMHAAKGLEWDVVILPGLGRTTARDQDRLLQWLDLPRPDEERIYSLVRFEKLWVRPRSRRADRSKHSSSGFAVNVRASSAFDCCMLRLHGRAAPCTCWERSSPAPRVRRLSPAPTVRSGCSGLRCGRSSYRPRPRASSCRAA